MNIGIILPSLGTNQLAFETITTINREIMSGSKHDYRIFFEDLTPRVINPLCAVMNIAEIWNYSGLLITTTLSNTRFASKVVGDVKKVFYVWDLEWLRGKNNFIQNLSVYRDPQFALLTRSEEYAKMIEFYSNRKVNGIMERLAFGALADVIK